MRLEQLSSSTQGSLLQVELGRELEGPRLGGWQGCKQILSLVDKGKPTHLLSWQP